VATIVETIAVETIKSAATSVATSHVATGALRANLLFCPSACNLQLPLSVRTVL
jgi:hypothetical protein